VGKEIAFLFLVSNGLNELFKHGFRGPRPYWLNSTLERAQEPTYGVPSGHVQYTTTIFLYLAGEIRRPWAWVSALLFIILMGLSRIYLGLHFIHDVLAGFLVAVLLLSIFWLVRRKWGRSLARRILGQRLLVMLSIPFAIVLLYVGVRLAIGAPDAAVSWAEYIPAAEREGVENVTTAVAALIGFGIGILMEGSRVRFTVDGPIWQRVGRYLLGMLVTVAIWAGIRLVTPEEPLALSLGLRFVRYTLLTLWISWYAPALFVWLKLTEAKPEPILNISLREPPPT
jgi:hypothetical protein